MTMLPQRKIRQLGIGRSFRREMASVQKELAGGHRTKLGRGKGREFLLQLFEREVGTIISVAAWRSGSTSAAGQGQVRAEGPLFSRNLEHSHFFVDGGGNRGKFRTGLHANPEHAGCLYCGEKTIAPKINRRFGSCNRGERFFNSFEGRLRLFADNLQRYVQ